MVTEEVTVLFLINRTEDDQTLEHRLNGVGFHRVDNPVKFWVRKYSIDEVTVPLTIQHNPGGYGRVYLPARKEGVKGLHVTSYYRMGLDTSDLTAKQEQGVLEDFRQRISNIFLIAEGQPGH